MQKQWMGDVTYLLCRLFNSTKPANQRKETVKIADIAEHNKEDSQRNTKITRS